MRFYFFRQRRNRKPDSRWLHFTLCRHMALMAVLTTSSAPAVESPHWLSRNPPDHVSSISALANDQDSRFVAVGEAGTILVTYGDNPLADQPDTWRPAHSGTRVWLRSIARKDSLWVIVGDQGTVLTSSNRVDWKSRNSGTSQDLQAVAADNQEWIAVGRAGTILRSPDGFTWSRVPNTLNSTHWRCLATRKEGVWILGGEKGAIATLRGDSLNPAKLDTHDDVLAVETGRENVRGWLAAAGTWIYASASGQVWKRQAELPEIITALQHNTVSWAAVGMSGMAAASYDGINWTRPTLTKGIPLPEQDLWTVSYATGRYLLAGANGSFLFGSGNVLANLAPLRKTELLRQKIREDFHSIATEGPSWMVAGDLVRAQADRIPISNAWPIPTTPSLLDRLGRPQVIHSIATAPGLWIAVGPAGFVGASINSGLSWNQDENSGTQLNLHAVKHLAALWVAVGEGGVIRYMRSEDPWGIWKPALLNFPSAEITWLDLDVKDGQWVAVGTGGKSAMSADGIHWALGPETGDGLDLQSVYGAQGVWVTVGEAGSIYASSELASWNPIESPTAASLDHVTFGRGQWVATGEDGTLLVASNVLKWHPVTVPAPTRIYAAEFVQNTHWLIAGTGGLALIHEGALPIPAAPLIEGMLTWEIDPTQSQQITLIWQLTTASEYVLQESPTLDSRDWKTLVALPEREGSIRRVTLAVGRSRARFFRLLKL